MCLALRVRYWKSYLEWIIMDYNGLLIHHGLLYNGLFLWVIMNLLPSGYLLHSHGFSMAHRNRWVYLLIAW